MSNLKKFVNLGKKIVCVGKNYPENASDVNLPSIKKPIVFAKTTSSYLTEELGVIIGKPARNIAEGNALNHIGGYTIALDMLARDIQLELRKQGHPWYISKSFDTASPVGSFVSTESIPDPHNVEIYCLLNGETRQKSSTQEMRMSIAFILEYMSKFVTLETGDLVLTGSPAGFGQCKSGDKLEIGITGITSAKFEVE
uniref:oxaloacetate tautomerase n=1 Tax=Ditylenchus dipsaci TaxID=166011 RepID=A0A915DP51_9BILA